MEFPITIELGRGVLELFTQELGFFESLYKDKDLGDLFAPFIRNLRKDLERQCILLPRISYSYDSDLPDMSIRLTYSIYQKYYEIHNCASLKSLLIKIAESYAEFYDLRKQESLFVLTCDLAELAECGHESLLAGRYNKAMDCYDKATYLFSVFGEIQEPLIGVLYNAAYIHYVNNRSIDEAVRLAKWLVNIVERDDFYDPVIRYEIHTFIAKLLWVHGNPGDQDHEEAVEYFKQAYIDIENLNRQPDLKMLALWNVISACFDEGQELSELCLDSFKLLITLINGQPNLVSSNYRIQLLSLHNDLLTAAHARDQQANAILATTITQQQQIINEQARRLSAHSLACSYIRKAGHLLLDVYAIALPRHWNFISLKNTVVDRGSMVAGEAFGRNG